MWAAGAEYHDSDRSISSKRHKRVMQLGDEISREKVEWRPVERYPSAAAAALNANLPLFCHAVLTVSSYLASRKKADSNGPQVIP